MRGAFSTRRRARATARSLIRVALVAFGVDLLAVGMVPGHAQGLVGLDRSLDHSVAVGTPQTRLLPPMSAGDLASSPGEPSADLRFSTGSFHPAMQFVFDGLSSKGFGLSSLVSPESSQFGPFATAPQDVTVTAGAGELGVGTRAAVRGGAAAVRPNRGPPAWRAIPPQCLDDEAERQLQAGGEFWSPQAKSSAPVQFPAAVFVGSRRGSADPLALGPTGHPINLPAAGPAGSWCRPPPMPVWQSSPFMTRAFWIVVLFPVLVFLVFLLSRGFQIRAIHETN